MPAWNVPPGDRDRLFAVPIVDYLGQFSSLPEEVREELRHSNAYRRAAMIETQLKGLASSDDKEQFCSRWLLGALSELETWELMLRLRTRSRNKSGRRAQGGHHE